MGLLPRLTGPYALVGAAALYDPGDPRRAAVGAGLGALVAIVATPRARPPSPPALMATSIFAGALAGFSILGGSDGVLLGVLLGLSTGFLFALVSIPDYDVGRARPGSVVDGLDRRGAWLAASLAAGLAVASRRLLGGETWPDASALVLFAVAAAVTLADAIAVTRAFSLDDAGLYDETETVPAALPYREGAPVAAHRPARTRALGSAVRHLVADVLIVSAIATFVLL
jgi:hypothetical protein